MRVPVPGDVAILEEDGDRLAIVIPPNPPRLLSSGVLLAVAGVALAFAGSVLSALANVDGPVLPVLLGAATLAVLLFCIPLLRMARFSRRGRETVLIDGEALEIVHEVGPRSRRWRYALDELSRVRFEVPDAESDWSGDRPPTHGLPPGMLAATHARRPLRFGLGLDVAEARRVAARIARFLRARGRGDLVADEAPPGDVEVPDLSPGLPDLETPWITRPSPSSTTILLWGLAALVLVLVVAPAALLLLGHGAQAPLLLFPLVVSLGLGGGLAFRLAGRESFQVAGGDLVVERRLLGFRRARRYLLAAVEAPRVRRQNEDLRPRLRRTPGFGWPLVTTMEGLRRGRLLFDYGAATIDCGVFLDALLAERLAGALGAAARAAHPPAERTP